MLNGLLPLFAAAIFFLTFVSPAIDPYDMGRRFTYLAILLEQVLLVLVFVTTVGGLISLYRQARPNHKPEHTQPDERQFGDSGTG